MSEEKNRKSLKTHKIFCSGYNYGDGYISGDRAIITYYYVNIDDNTFIYNPRGAIIRREVDKKLPLISLERILKIVFYFGE